MKNLAIALRPQSLDQILGMPDVVTAIKNQLQSGRIPNCWLFIGEPGTGKTSLAYIIAREIQGKDYKGDVDIVELNGADSTGIDNMRVQIERSKYNPMTGIYRCVILNEAQKLTDAAQQALLVPTEDKESTTIWFLTTTDPSKLNEALLSRCGASTYKLKGLDHTGRYDLVEKAIKATGTTLPSKPLLELIDSAGITSGRDIVNAVEMYANGIPPELAVQSSDVDPQYMEIAKLVMTGNWNKIVPVLRKLKPVDAKPLRQIISGFGRNQLLTSSQSCAIMVSQLLKEIALYQAYENGIDLSALFAIIYGYCQKMNGGK
jgi:replication-associated recombination protein RarA